LYLEDISKINRMIVTSDFQVQLQEKL